MKKKYFEDISRKLLMMILLVGGFLTQAVAQNYIFVYKVLDAESVEYGTDFDLLYELGGENLEVWRTEKGLSSVKTEIANYNDLITKSSYTKLDNLPDWLYPEIRYSGAPENDVNGAVKVKISGSVGYNYWLWSGYFYILLVEKNKNIAAENIISLLNTDNREFTLVESVTKTVKVYEDDAFKIGIAGKHTVGLLKQYIKNQLDANIGVDGLSAEVTAMYRGTAPTAEELTNPDEVLISTSATESKAYGYNFKVNCAAGSDPGVVLKFTHNDDRTTFLHTTGATSWTYATPNAIVKPRLAIHTTDADVVTHYLPGVKELTYFVGEELTKKAELESYIQKYLQDQLDNESPQYNATIANVKLYDVTNNTAITDEVLVPSGSRYSYRFTIVVNNTNDDRLLKYVVKTGSEVANTHKTLVIPTIAGGNGQTVQVKGAIQILETPQFRGIPTEQTKFEVNAEKIKSQEVLAQLIIDRISVRSGMPYTMSFLEEIKPEHITFIDNEGNDIAAADFPLTVGEYDYKITITAKDRVYLNVLSSYVAPVPNPYLLEAGETVTFTSTSNRIQVTPFTEDCLKDPADDTTYLDIITFEEPNALDNIFGNYLGFIHFRNMVDAFNIDDIVTLHELFPNNFNASLEAYDFEQLGLWFVPTQRLKFPEYKTKIAALVDPTVEDIFEAIGAVRYTPNDEHLMHLAQMGYYDVMVVLPQDEEVVIDASGRSSCNVIDGYNLGRSNFLSSELALSEYADIFSKVWVSEYPVVVFPKVLKTATFPAFMEGSPSDLMPKGNLQEAGKIIRDYILETYQGEKTDEFIEQVLFYKYNKDNSSELGEFIGYDTQENAETIFLDPTKTYSYSIVLNGSYIPLPELGIGISIGDDVEVSLQALVDELTQHGPLGYLDLLNVAYDSYSEAELLLAIKANLTFKAEVGSGHSVLPNKLALDLLRLIGFITDGFIGPEQPFVYEYGMVNAIHVRKDAAISLKKYEVGAVGYLNQNNQPIESAEQQLIDIIYKDVAASLIGSTLQIAEDGIEIFDFENQASEGGVIAKASYKVTLEPTKKVGEITATYYDAAGVKIEDANPTGASDGDTTIEAGRVYTLTNWISFIENKEFIAGQKISGTLTLPIVDENIIFGMTAKEMGEEIKAQIFAASNGFFDGGGYTEQEKVDILAILENLVEVQVLENTIAGAEVKVYGDNDYPKASLNDLYAYRLYMTNAAANTFNRLFNDLAFEPEHPDQDVNVSTDVTKFLVDAYRSLQVVKKDNVVFHVDHFTVDASIEGLTEKQIIAYITAKLIADEANAEFFFLAAAAGVKTPEEAFTVTVVEGENNLYKYSVKFETLVTQNVEVEALGAATLQVNTVEMIFKYPTITAQYSIDGDDNTLLSWYDGFSAADKSAYNAFLQQITPGGEMPYTISQEAWEFFLYSERIVFVLYGEDNLLPTTANYKDKAIAYGSMYDLYEYVKANYTDGTYNIGLIAGKEDTDLVKSFIPFGKIATVTVVPAEVVIEFNQAAYDKVFGTAVVTGSELNPALTLSTNVLPIEFAEWIVDTKDAFAAATGTGTYTISLNAETLAAANANAVVGRTYKFGRKTTATVTIGVRNVDDGDGITVNIYREYGEEDSTLKFSFGYDTNNAVLHTEVIPFLLENATASNYVVTGSAFNKKTDADTYDYYTLDADALSALLTNYSEVTFKKGKFTITQAPLTIKINDASREFGAANPEFTISYIGFKNNETASKDVFDENVQPTAITYATATTRDSAPIVFGKKPNARNYDVTWKEGTLYIGKIARTIVWDQEDPLTIEVGDQVEFSARVETGSNVQYYDDIKFELTNGNCPYIELNYNSTTGKYYVVAKAASHTSLEKILVTASCTGNNDDFAPAATVTKEIIIVDGDGDVTKPRFFVTGLTTTYDGTHRTICATIMDESGEEPKQVNDYYVSYRGYGDTEYDEQRNGPINAGTYEVKVVAKLGDNEYTYIAPNKLIVNRKPVQIIAQNLKTTYGQALPAYSDAYTMIGAPKDLKVSDKAPVIVLDAPTVQTPAGMHKLRIVVEPDLFGDNYCFDLQDGLLLVEKAPLSIVANDVTATYGDALKALTYDLIGMQYNQTVEHLGFEPRISTTATAASNAGTYDIIVTGAEEADNYELEYVNGDYVINQASQFIVWNQEAAKFDIFASETVELAMPQANSGREVTLVSSAPEIATVELVDGEWIMTLISEGEVTITAELAGDVNYLAADPISVDFEVINSTGIVAIGDGQIKVYPTLFVNTINVLAQSAVSRVDVISYTGAIVKTVNNPTTNIDLSSLGSGDYLLKVTTVDGVVATAKVVKQ